MTFCALTFCSKNEIDYIINVKSCDTDLESTGSHSKLAYLIVLYIPNFLTDTEHESPI